MHTCIVRDAAILDLYRMGGILYILLGIESTEPKVLRKIKKGSITREDLAALRLFERHGIFSIVAHVVGSKDETWESWTFWPAAKGYVCGLEAIAPLVHDNLITFNMGRCHYEEDSHLRCGSWRHYGCRQFTEGVGRGRVADHYY